jgi:exonuclease-1
MLCSTVVAPYEADAQLSFLCAHNLVDGVISEDSDCIPYHCSSVLFKLDKRTGTCAHLSLRTLQTQSRQPDSFDLQGFSRAMLVAMCVASGCDYAASPRNFGLKSSYRLVRKLKTPGRLLK